MPLNHSCNFLTLRCTSSARVTLVSRVKRWNTSRWYRSFLAMLIFLRICSIRRHINHPCWYHHSIYFTMISNNKLPSFFLILIKRSLNVILVMLQCCCWPWCTSIQVSTLVHRQLYLLLLVRCTLLMYIILLRWAGVVLALGRTLILFLNKRTLPAIRNSWRVEICLILLRHYCLKI